MGKSKPAAKTRILRVESLERRQLLASDLQNHSNPLDVDNDLVISPIDALKVMNDIRRYGKSIGSGGILKTFTDVDGDAERTPLDALFVMNAIRRRIPDVTFKLTHDTDRNGGTKEDRRTHDLGVVGKLNFPGQTKSLSVTAETGDQAAWIDVSSHVNEEGDFEFDDASIRSILGSQVNHGKQSIRFRSGSVNGLVRRMELEVLAAPPLPRLVSSEINEDQEIRLDLVGETYDPDSPIASLKLTIHEQPQSGTLIPSGQAFVYRPDDNYFGDDFIVYEIEDEDDTSGKVTLAVSIAAVNDPPKLTTVSDVELRMSDGILEIPYHPVDEDGEPLDLIAFATVPNPLVEIRDAYGLFDVGDDYFDLTGLKEKWLFGKDETSFFILPDGDFIQWSGSYADTAKRETLIARLDPSVYEDPSQLFDPAPAVLAPVIVVVEDGKLIVSPEAGLFGEIEVTVIAADPESATSQSFKVMIDPQTDEVEVDQNLIEDFTIGVETLEYSDTKSFLDALDAKVPLAQPKLGSEVASILNQMRSLYNDAQDSIFGSNEFKEEFLRVNAEQISQFDAIKAKLDSLKTEYQTQWNAYQARRTPNLSIDESIVPIFIHGNQYPDPIQVYRGETINIDFRAVHPVKSMRYRWGSDEYTDYGNIVLDAHDGQFTWHTPSNVEGIYDFSVTAIVDDYRQSRIDFQVEILPNEPVVPSLSISPATVSDTGTDPITLTANGAFHPLGKSVGVEFFQDIDGNGEFNASIDRFLGNGSSWTGTPYPVASGDTATFFARAFSHTFSARLESVPASVTADLVTTPKLNLDFVNETSGHEVVDTITGSEIDVSQIARYGDDKAAVVYSDNGSMFVQRYSGADDIRPGQKVGSPVKLGDFTSQQYGIHADADGNVIVLFSNGNSSGNNPDGIAGSGLWMVRLDATDTVVSPVQTLATINNSEGYVITSEMNASGQGFVAWKGYYSAPEVYLLTFTDNGATQSEIMTLPYDGGFNDGGVWTSSDINDQGRFAIHWSGQLLTGQIDVAESIEVRPFSFNATQIAINAQGWAVMASPIGVLVIDPLGRPAGEPLPVVAPNNFYLHDIQFDGLQVVKALYRNRSNSSTIYAQREFQLRLQPGLIITELVAGNPSSLDAGSNLGLTYSIENPGSAPTEALDVVFYLSRDEIIDPSDRILASRHHSQPIAAGSTQGFDTTLALPPHADPIWLLGDDLLNVIAAVPSAGTQQVTPLGVVNVQYPDPNQKTGDENSALIVTPRPVPVVNAIRPEVVLAQVGKDEFNQSDHFVELIGNQFISAAKKLYAAAPPEIANAISELIANVEYNLETFAVSQASIAAREVELDRIKSARDQAKAAATARTENEIRVAALQRDELIRKKNLTIQTAEDSRTQKIADETANLQKEINLNSKKIDDAGRATDQIRNYLSNIKFAPFGLTRLGASENPFSKKAGSVIGAAKSTISQGGKCARDPGECAEKAVTQVSNEANKLKEKAKATFGPVIEKLKKAITDLPAKIDAEIKKVTAPAVKAIADAKAAYNKFEEKWIAKKNAAIAEADKTYDDALKKIPKVDQAIANATEQVVVPSLSKVTDTLDSVIQNIDSPEGLIEQLKADVKAIDEQNIFGSVEDAIEGAKAGGEFAKAALEQLTEKLKPVVDVLNESGGKFSDWSKDTGGKTADWSKEKGVEVADWVKENIADALDEEVIAYKATTDFDLTFNLTNGSLYLDAKLGPGLAYDSRKLNQLIKGDLNPPDLDPVDALKKLFSAQLISTNNYNQVRDGLYKEFGADSVYFASNRLVSYLGAESAAEIVAEVILYGGSAAKDALQELGEQIRLEVNDIMGWLQLKGEEQVAKLVPSILKALILQEDFESPHLELRWTPVTYRYEIKENPILGKAIKAVAGEEASLASLIGRKDLAEESRHMGFSIIWQIPNPGDPLDHLQGYLDDFEFGSLDGPSITGELVDAALEELGKQDIPPRVIDFLQELRPLVIDVGKFEKFLAKTVNDLLDFDFDYINAKIEELKKLKDAGFVLNLAATPAAIRLGELLNYITFGNVKKAEVTSMTFDLTTFTLKVSGKLCHKHSWGTIGDIVKGLGKAAKEA